jgi:hypothetical protein
VGPSSSSRTGSGKPYDRNASYRLPYMPHRRNTALNCANAPAPLDNPGSGQHGQPAQPAGCAATLLSAGRRVTPQLGQHAPRGAHGLTSAVAVRLSEPWARTVGTAGLASRATRRLQHRVHPAYGMGQAPSIGLFDRRQPSEPARIPGGNLAGAGAGAVLGGTPSPRAVSQRARAALFRHGFLYENAAKSYVD